MLELQQQRYASAENYEECIVGNLRSKEPFSFVYYLGL